MLTLIESRERLWERFVSGDVSPEEAALPEVSHWQRSQSLGAQPIGPAHPEGVGDAELRDRRERLFEAFTDGASLLQRLAHETAARDFRAVLTDDEGVIVLTHGGGASSRGADAARLIAGANWAEPSRGTNAIGTALVEQAPVAVVGRAHYEECNHGLVCYAAPLRDAAGELLGVLDVTGSVEHAHPLMEALVLASAHAVEQSLRRRTYESLLLGSRGPSLMVEAPGIIGLVSASAAARMGRTPESLRQQSVESVLGVSFAKLCEAATKGATLTHGSITLRLEPHLNTLGRVLAVSVTIESRAARGTMTALPAPFQTLLGSDAKLEQNKQLAAKVAASKLPVLLLAETGTGKELMARAIHASSAVKSGPFVALNCGALSQTLLESELFGYAPGAFTGAATTGTLGKLGAADGGTLFLDEVAEMPAAVQAMLLRVLEEGQYYRLGDPKPRRTSFRLISATCRDLVAMVDAGQFRNDLFFRIRGATVSVPPLRERSDLNELARGLLAKLASEQELPMPVLSTAAASALAAYRWPGNVRELKTALTHAMVLASGDESIELEHLPPEVTSQRPVALKAEFERSALDAAMANANGNLSEAARQLGVARTTLYRMLKRHRS